MAFDWRLHQEQVERNEKRVRDLQETFQGQNQRDSDAHRRKNAAQHAKTIPTYPAIAWGSLGLGGCAAFLLGIVFLAVASMTICCGMIHLTSHAKPSQPVPHQATPKHQGRPRHGTSIHPFPRR